LVSEIDLDGRDGALIAEIKLEPLARVAGCSGPPRADVLIDRQRSAVAAGLAGLGVGGVRGLAGGGDALVERQQVPALPARSLLALRKNAAQMPAMNVRLTDHRVPSAASARTGLSPRAGRRVG